MPLPMTVETVLRDSAVQYTEMIIEPQMWSLSEWSPRGVVQTQLVRSEARCYQVIYPEGAMLDIQAISYLLGYALTVLTDAEVLDLCGQKGLVSLPALPILADMLTVIDEQLLDGEQVSIDGGDGQHVIHMTIDNYRQLFRDSVVGRFSVPLASISQSPLDHVRDVEEITKAVANFTQLRIKQRLEETLDFPLLPDTAQKIIKLRVNPYANIKDLVEIVETDASLAAQVVSWAGSAFYAAPGKVQSIHDAIVRVLGFELVLNLALGLSLGNMLKLPKDAPQGFTPYWLQSVYVATTIEALVKVIPAEKRPTVGLAYLSGLLHNFGYLLLAEIFTPHFSQYCRLQEANPHLNHAYIERYLLGVTREQISGWLMQVWHLPSEVVTALRYQNAADYVGDEHEYALLLFIAERLLRQRGIGDAPLESIPRELFDRIGLDPEQAHDVMDKIMGADQDIRAMARNLGASA